MGEVYIQCKLICSLSVCLCVSVCMHMYHIAGCFRGRNFSQIGLLQLFEGKIFTTGNWLVKFLKISPSRNPLYSVYLCCVCVHDCVCVQTFQLCYSSVTIVISVMSHDVIITITWPMTITPDEITTLYSMCVLCCVEYFVCMSCNIVHYICGIGAR